MGAVDRDSPRELRRRAIELLVEEVPPAPDCLHREQGGGDDVRPHPPGKPVIPDKPDERDDPGDQAAVHAQPGIRRQYDLQQVMLIQGPLIDDVIQPTTDQRRDRDHDQAVPDDLRILAEPSRLTHEDGVTGEQTHGIRDAVPVHRQRSEVEGDRVDEEVDHGPGVYAARRSP